jgi:hypothetical protein
METAKEIQSGVFMKNYMQLQAKQPKNTGARISSLILTADQAADLLLFPRRKQSYRSGYDSVSRQQVGGVAAHEPHSIG